MTEKVSDTFLTEKVFDTHVMVPVEKKVSDTHIVTPMSVPLDKKSV